MYWMYNKDDKDYVIEATKDFAAELVNLDEYEVNRIDKGASNIYGLDKLGAVQEYDPGDFSKAVLEYEIIDDDYNMSPFTERFLYDKYEEELERRKEDDEHKRLELTY